MARSPTWRKALAWHRRAIATGLGGMSFFLAARMAEGLAGVALLNGEVERAALLLGVGAALRGTRPAGDADVERVAGRCRTALGDAMVERLYGRAREMVRERLGTGRMIAFDDL